VNRVTRRTDPRLSRFDFLPATQLGADHATWWQVGLHREAAASGSAYRRGVRASGSVPEGGRTPRLGDRERDVGRREEVGFRTRSQDKQGPGQEGRASGWTCLGGASQIGALGIGPEGRGDAEAESRGRPVLSCQRAQSPW